MSAPRTRVLVGGALLAIAAPLLIAGPAHAEAPPDCSDFNSQVTQIAREGSGASLLTSSPAEIASARAFGYTDNLGPLATVATSAGEGLVPVWRLYRSGDFAYATEGADANAFVDDGYAKQFVEFYASADDNSCLAPISRLERRGTHRLADADDSQALIDDGWRLEKSAFYAVTDASPAPPPPPAPPPTGDTKFSIAVIPDTQNETGAGDQRFSNRVRYLTTNEAAFDLRYAMQIGDLSNWGHVAPAQFEKLSNEIRPLEATMPWAGAVGNHDTAAVCVGGSACPGANANITVRDTSTYNRYFPVSRFPNIRGTFESGKVDNSYQLFSAGGVNWMVLTLELWPRTSAVNWAKDVVAAHPNHNVIVNTHAYLNSDGSISTSNGGYGANSPSYLYDNLIKLYPNVKMVLSGHVGQAGSRTDVGVNGNKIASFLTTFHNSTNPVRLIEIDTAAGSVTSRIYAPLTDTDYPTYTTATSGLDFS